MKKTLALLLAVLMVVSLFAGCGNTEPAPTTGTEAPTQAPTTGTEGTTSTEPTVELMTGVAGEYTYKDSVSTLASNWNPHTYQNVDDAYPADFLRVGLYSFVFNDEVNAVAGKDAYTGYVIVPEMAAELPIDVTEQVKAEHPEFGIPESATAGYAYTIKLNPLATWEDGTPINADTYVESMERLLRAELLNYRAADYYADQFCIAGAENYANQGTSKYIDNASLVIADLVKNEDGTYSTANGEPVFVNVSGPNAYLGDPLSACVEAYGADYFGVDHWEELVAAANEEGYAPLTDDTLAWITDVVTGNPAWGEDETYLPNYIVYNFAYPETFDFANVGCYKIDEYTINIVLGKSLAGFQLLYNLTGNWIVKTDLYDACLTETDGAWTSTYNTSVETTSSYGPYKLVSFQSGKAMRFEKNDAWYGYTDGKHVYVDPVDGETYTMYQTNVIDTQVVEESATRKMMFLKGQLMGYGLQSDDFATYRNSEYCYATPGQTIFFLILNGHKESITNREAKEDFDTATTDIETLMLTSFHQALGLTYDKDLFAATISPARSGGYGIIGTAYIYDPDTGARYRDTDQAKQVLCDFYGVDVSAFASLDDAVASITGYDPELAKVYFNQAFQEALDAGYITDNDGDGVSDQTVKIEYTLSSDSDFMTKTIDYLNEKVAEVAAGTGFDGKIEFFKSAPYGNDWSNKIREGMSDTVLGGWSGSALNPFGLTDLYTNPARQYDAAWYDATKVELTINVPVNGENKDVTMTLKQWSDCLNGTLVTIDGVDYNYGDGLADVETRLNILAAIEGKILSSYNYLPMLEDGSMALLSQQVFYVVEEYNPIMGRGGIQYMKYNYDDAEWADYVNSQGGELKY